MSFIVAMCGSLLSGYVTYTLYTTGLHGLAVVCAAGAVCKTLSIAIERCRP